MTTNRYRSLSALLLTTLLAACGSAPQKSSIGVGSKRDQESVQRLIERRQLVSRRGDSVALAALFTDDAIVMPTNLRGSKAIKRWEEAFAEHNEMAAEYTVEEIMVDDKWAFVRLRIGGSLTRRPGGERAQVSGQELVVLERQPDGSWKIARLMANTNIPGISLP